MTRTTKLRYATEKLLPGGRIEINSSCSHRRKIIIEPAFSNSPFGALLRVRGASFSMNSTLKQYGGNWDPITRSWTVPAAKGIALRAYLCENF